jgi:hypothetical protein
MKALTCAIPTLNLTEIRPMDGALDVLSVEAELTCLPHLDADERMETEDDEHAFIDATRLKSAIACMGRRLPSPAQTIHVVVSGAHSLFDLIPATLELARPAFVENLYIATLGFSERNISGLCQMLDAKTLRRLTLLCSHYFRGTSATTYEYAREELARRPAARFLSLRSQAKVLLMRLSDERTVSIESSANLCSCKHIETLSVFGDPRVYAFHARWIDDLFAKARNE